MQLLFIRSALYTILCVCFLGLEEGVCVYVVIAHFQFSAPPGQGNFPGD